MNTKLSIICPCYNEENVVKLFLDELLPILKTLPINSFEIIFINDGSTDKTLQNLIILKKDLKEMLVINLSRNFGKEAALTAGLDKASGDIIIPIDVDLQDPVNGKGRPGDGRYRATDGIGRRTGKGFPVARERGDGSSCGQNAPESGGRGIYDKK